jgi:hypothetical protein
LSPVSAAKAKRRRRAAHKEPPDAAVTCCLLSQYEDRHQALRQQLSDVQRALGELGPGDRDPYPGEVERLESALAFVALVLERTEAALLSDSAYNELNSTTVQILASPAAAGPNTGAWSTQLLDASARLPAARDRELEQQLKDVTANFQRSTQQRLNATNEDLKKLQSALGEVEGSLDTRKQEIEAEMNQTSAAIQQRLGEFEATLTSQRQSIDQVAAQQTEAFTESQTKRQTDFDQKIEEAEGRVTEFLTNAQQEVDQRVQEIQRMERESAELVGAIGLAGTAERYGEEARDQKRTADRYRIGALVVATAAVVLAFVVALQSHPDTETFAGKLSVSILIGAIATYLARQSGRHRRREEKARSLQLELTAFSPFIEPLSPDQREEERVIMTRKTFGKTPADETGEEDELGPTPISHVLQARRPREG